MGQYGLLLSALLPEVPFERDFSFAEHTTVGLGGTADAFLPETAGQLQSVVRLCERCAVPYFPLGAGSNVLPPDGTYRGVVLVTNAFDRYAVEGDLLTAECGVGVGKLLTACKRHALGGLEFLTGIPAKVGGLAFMNAGVKEGRVGDVIESVTFLADGKIKTYEREKCRFSYKDSLFQHIPCVILSVRFRLKKSSTQEVENNISYFKEKRKHLPKGKSMGCVFKNPPSGLSAGELIEKSNCKNFKEGGAIVSPLHANFIINQSGATAKDFRALIHRVKEQVYKVTGVMLQEEIRYIE